MDGNGDGLEGIPIVDMQGPETKMIEQLGRAFTEFGFASLVNHGLSHELCERSYAVTREVFAHPDARLAQYCDAEGRGGYAGFNRYKVEHAEGRRDDQGDLKRFWHCRRDGKPNIAPDDLVPAFGSTMLEMFADLDELSFRVMEWTARFWGVDPSHFTDAIRGGDSLLRVIHYPEIPPEDAHLVRSSEHTDINWVTLLPAATRAGLEILRRDGVWMPVNNPTGAVIANVGDMLEAHSFGDFRSTKHRVGNVPGERFSMPFFIHPRAEVPLVTAKGFLDQRLWKIGLLKDRILPSLQG